MNIGIVTTWFERGAAYVSKQYREVLKDNHNVFIYVRGGEKYAENDSNWDVANLYWGKRFKYFAGSMIDLTDFKKWIQNNELDVVFFNEQHHWKPVVLCNHLKVKVGAYIDYYKKETLPFFNIYDFVICNTRHHYSVFKNHDQAHYVPWGTLSDVFVPQKKPVHLVDKLVFFHSAGMNPRRKGTDLVIKAASQIKDKDFILKIHTQVDLLDFIPEIKSELNNLKAQNKLSIIVKSISAPGIYHHGDIYVYPTRLEGIGLTIAEALSSGLPVITSNQAPMNEFVKDKINGRLVDVESELYRDDNYYWPQSIADITSLKKCMEWYLFQTPDELTIHKSIARSYAEQWLNWKKNACDLGTIFKHSKMIDSEEKNKAINICLEFEKKRNFIWYINNFMPYVIFKRKIKRLIK